MSEANNFSRHFQAAVDLINRSAEDKETLIDAITDRSYDEVEISTRTLEEGLAKFEIDTSELDVSASWLHNEFMLHNCGVYEIKDRRFKYNTDPERLVIVLTSSANPVRDFE